MPVQFKFRGEKASKGESSTLRLAWFTVDALY